MAGLVLIDGFSYLYAAKSSAELSEVVSAHSEQLERDFPGITDRYATSFKAARSMIRAIRNREIETYLIKKPGGAVKGVGSVILNREVEIEALETRKVLKGVNIAFWMVDASEEERIKVAKRMVGLGQYHRPSTGDSNVFALLRPDGSDASRELAQLMRPISEPGLIVDKSHDDQALVDEIPRQAYVI